MRIPDELQIFNVGDEVKTVAGQTGIVTSVSSCSVYYEHRPIASFMRFNYSVDIDGDIHHLRLDEIIVSH